MKTLSGRTRRVVAFKAMLSGAGSIAIDQHIGLTERTPRNGLASDWKAVGNDLKQAMKQIGHEHEAA